MARELDWLCFVFWGVTWDRAFREVFFFSFLFGGMSSAVYIVVLCTGFYLLDMLRGSKSCLVVGCGII